MSPTHPSLVPTILNQPSEEQRRWLRMGLHQAGGKLPLYDEQGNRISHAVITSCEQAGWAEPWAANPTRSKWQVCRLTEAGRNGLLKEGVIRVDFTQWKRDSGDQVGYGQAAASSGLIQEVVRR